MSSNVRKELRTLVIGDIHGGYNALAALIDAVDLKADDQLIFLGDYIDGSSDSKKVLDWLVEKRSAKSNFVFLRGNHELMILDARDDPDKFHLWQTYGGDSFLASYQVEDSSKWVSQIPRTHWEFLENTVPFYETDTEIFVHACLDPGCDLAQQPLHMLYWKYCDDIRPHKSGKRIICGHTSQKSGLIRDLGFAVCIDTDACGGKWLTCLDVTTNQYWQSNELRDIQTGKLI